MELDEAVEAIESTLDQADALYRSGAPALRQILVDAEKSIAAKLQQVTKVTGAKGKWTEASAHATMAQVRLTQEYVDKRLAGLTHDQAKKALAKSVKSTVGLMTTLEKRFTGSSEPLQLQKAGAMHSLINQSATSLLSRNAASVQRYGAAMVADFERVIRTGLVTGASNHEMIHALISAGAAKGVTAAKLKKGDPKYFPTPTGYMRKQYWAERIIRTETAYAYNRGSYDSIAASRKQFPDMQKKILATFDARTAPDSVAVHGQIRNVEDLFMDGAGRQYLHPPGRPNDRETIVPWRSSWPELSNTAPVAPEQAAAAEVAATPNVGELTPAQKKAAMMAAITGKKQLLEAKEQAAKQSAEAAAAASKQAKATEAAGKGLSGSVAMIEAEAAVKAAEASAAKLVAKKAALVEKLSAPITKSKAYQEKVAKAAEKKAAAEKSAQENAIKKAAAKEAAAEKKARKVAAAATAKRAAVSRKKERQLPLLDAETAKRLLPSIEGSSADGSEMRTWVRQLLRDRGGMGGNRPNRAVQWSPEWLSEGASGATSPFERSSIHAIVGIDKETRANTISALKNVALGKPLTDAQSGSLKVFIHEEVHLATRSASWKLEDHNLFVEEVTTELAAQHLAYKAGVYSEPLRYKETAKTNKNLTGSMNRIPSYYIEASTLIEDVRAVTGWEDQPALERVTEAALRMRGDSVPLGKNGHADDFAQALDIPEEKRKLLLERLRGRRLMF